MSPFEKSSRKRLGYALCGSFCTIHKAVEQLEMLSKDYDIVPIVSDKVYETDTRFGRAVSLICRMEEICSHKVIHTIVDAEPLGPKLPLDALVIAPCTGNTLAKLANAVTDTPVTMAAKAHLRSDRPLILALASNDALSGNLRNIATMLERKNVYFVPFAQDDPWQKPHSLVADFSLLADTITDAMAGKQRQPLLLPAGSTGI